MNTESMNTEVLAGVYPNDEPQRVRNTISRNEDYRLLKKKINSLVWEELPMCIELREAALLSCGIFQLFIGVIEKKERVAAAPEEVKRRDHCCEISCKKPAEWGIYADGVPDTTACTEHVGQMLTDSPEHRVYPI